MTEPTQEEVAKFERLERDLTTWVTDVVKRGVAPDQVSAALVRCAAVMAQGLLMSREDFLVGATAAYETVQLMLSAPHASN